MSAIEKLVEFNGGPVAVARALGGAVAYQEVQRWVKRGYGAPKHFQRLATLLPPGMTINDLFADMPDAGGGSSRKTCSAAHERAAV
ncbi:hypothetical protein [Cupriavidus alkaliphilus]|uniref:YdaS antitoxin of YdaST toxin-antitoxin system n=1 Tax=Cupriavidus alkaliphilus TaxID=942866 RepID=A0A7W4VGR6_9BURK|nr:hypothetical protein [Cupriavidus alkaliphilus]MBB3010675.1 hypothetical protein [Cupriavidus alkaliphilus]